MVVATEIETHLVSDFLQRYFPFLVCTHCQSLTQAIHGERNEQLTEQTEETLRRRIIPFGGFIVNILQYFPVYAVLQQISVPAESA
jgi:hypothetical protein